MMFSPSGSNRRSTRVGRASTVSQRSGRSSSHHMGVRLEKAQNWIRIPRPPAVGVGFEIPTWVPVSQLTPEEAQQYLPNPVETQQIEQSDDLETTTASDKPLADTKLPTATKSTAEQPPLFSPSVGADGEKPATNIPTVDMVDIMSPVTQPPPVLAQPESKTVAGGTSTDSSATAHAASGTPSMVPPQNKPPDPAMEASMSIVSTVAEHPDTSSVPNIAAGMPTETPTGQAVEVPLPENDSSNLPELRTNQETTQSTVTVNSVTETTSHELPTVVLEAPVANTDVPSLPQVQPLQPTERSNSVMEISNAILSLAAPVNNSGAEKAVDISNQTHLQPPEAAIAGNAPSPAVETQRETDHQPPPSTPFNQPPIDETPAILAHQSLSQPVSHNNEPSAVDNATESSEPPMPSSFDVVSDANTDEPAAKRQRIDP